MVVEKATEYKLGEYRVGCWETASAGEAPVLPRAIMVKASTSESVTLGPHKQHGAQERTLQNTDSSSLKTSWKEITVAFIMRTKIHGLKFVFSPDKSKPQRLIWSMAFVVCVGLLATWSWNRILYLMSYPAVTKIYMVWAHNMSFPAVTFCNKNVFRVSTLTKDDLYHSGYWMDLLYPNHTVMERSLSILKENQKQGLLSLLDFKNYSPPPGYRINTTEMMGRLGHQLKDMLLECRFRGETCTYKNFSTVCTWDKTRYFMTGLYMNVTQNVCSNFTAVLRSALSRSLQVWLFQTHRQTRAFSDVTPPELFKLVHFRKSLWEINTAFPSGCGGKINVFNDFGVHFTGFWVSHSASVSALVVLKPQQ